MEGELGRHVTRLGFRRSTFNPKTHGGSCP
jgi:hypothetical protein